MKKLLSLCLIFVLVFSFAACKDSIDEETTVEQNTDAETPVVSLLADVTEVSAGDTVEVSVHIGNSRYTACFDIFVFADETLGFESSRSSAGDTNLILADNYVEDETGKYVAVRGIVASTTDVMDNSVCKITYKVADTAVSGDKIAVTVQIPSYQLGVDETGNEVYSVTDAIIVNNLVVTVK